MARNATTPALESKNEATEEIIDITASDVILRNPAAWFMPLTCIEEIDLRIQKTLEERYPLAA